MELSRKDWDDNVSRYSQRFQEHGYAPETLGWNKGRQPVRFDVLTGFGDLSGKTIVDIGCGFGGLNRTLRAKWGEDCTYTGVELVEDLVKEAQQRYPEPNVRFIHGEFLDDEIHLEADVAIASGVFNYRFEDTDNYAFIEATMQKAFALCKDGLAFYFLSDRVDYELPHTFHSNPGRILDMASGLSRNLVLRNDYIPFEFSLYLYKDDTFVPEQAVFEKYERESRHDG
jgi:SAM-dependent methyltransferase